MKSEEKKSSDPPPENKEEDKSSQPEIPPDQQLLNYAYNMQLIGEDKMSKFSFKEACDYMIAAADNYIKVRKTSKNKELVDFANLKLPALLDRVCTKLP